MIRATVIRPVWATKRVDGFPAGALLEVEEVGTSHRLIALDQLGAGPGESVLVTRGSAVTRHLAGNPPLDALIVGVLDESTNKASAISDASVPEERK